MRNKPLISPKENHQESQRGLAGDVQLTLAKFNRRRLQPRIPSQSWREELDGDRALLELEGNFVESARNVISPLVSDVPQDASGFLRWFESLKHEGPGQTDPLFPFLAAKANYQQMKWFLGQEVAGEAGFDDLVALTQTKMPIQPKLEMARNYWDEMGRGTYKGMHGPMLERLAQHFGLTPTHEVTVDESLALGNMMMALACNRRYAFHSVGALGVIEMTAPIRARYVYEGLHRLGVPADGSHYFSLHAVLDVKHSQAWNEEVLKPLVTARSECVQSIAEGAILRLWCGALCFDRYRRELNLNFETGAAA